MAEAKPQSLIGEGAIGKDWNAYQLTLAGMIFPVAGHWLFDALAGICVAMLGHPWVGAVMFGSTAIFDTFQQKIIGRWLRDSAGMDPLKGLRRLAALCGLRMVVYVAPTTYLAATGHVAKLRRDLNA